MTLDQLKKRRVALLAQKDQAVGQANAVAGAISFCDELIAQMEAAEKKDAEQQEPMKAD